MKLIEGGFLPALILFGHIAKLGWSFNILKITCFVFLTVDGDLENHDVSQLPKETLDTIEADSFWCMSKLLDGIQVMYSSPYTPLRATCTCTVKIEQWYRSRANE